MFENWNEAKNVLMEGLSSTHKEILDPLLENQKPVKRSPIPSASSVDGSPELPIG